MNLSFNEFLLLDETDFGDFQKCFFYVKNYLEELHASNFKHEKILHLRGLLGKFIQFGDPIRANYSTAFDDILSKAKDLETYVHTYSSNGNQVSSLITSRYQFLYSDFLEAYNKINFYFRSKRNDSLSFDGLFQYEMSDKKRAIDLIAEAIYLIEHAHGISEKSKKKIIDHLTAVISELNNPSTRWPQFFLKISEAILIIGALSSIISGITDANQLFSAGEKLKDAQETIIKTSININQNNLRQTFIIDGSYKIEDNKIALPEKQEEVK